MKNERKTKKQLIEELGELRKTVTELERHPQTSIPSPYAPLRSAERYLNLIETIQEGLVIVDEEEKIVFVNEPFCVILDYLEEYLIGMNLLDLVPESEKHKILEATQRKGETGEATRYEIQLIRQGGDLRDVLVSTSPLFYEDDEYATLGVITDITERKRIERELQKHRDHLEELVGERTVELRRTNQTLKSEIEERKLAEEALRESEEKYRTFIQDFKGIAYRSDLNFVPMFIHGAVEEITGYTANEFTSGQPSLDQVVHPEDYKNIANGTDEIKNIAHSIIEREYRITRKDGDIRWVIETIQNVCDESDKPIYIHGVISDITSRKKAEAALHESEDKYRDLVENINDGISSVNAKGIITYASPAFERITGLAPNEIVGKHINEFVYSPDTESSGEVFKNILSGAGPMEADIRFITKRGDAKWVRIAARRAFDQDGELTLRCVISDINKRKKVEDELRIKNVAVESSVNGFVLTDLNGADSLITYANPSCLRMWGYSKAEEAIGKPISDFYKDKTKAIEITKTLRDAGSWIGEIIGTKKDDSKIPLHLSINTVKDEKDEPICAILSFVDLTELKSAETALRESEARLNATLNALPDILFEVDQGGRILDFRTRFPDLLYAPPSGFINKTIREVVPEKAANVIMDVIAKAATTDEYINAEYSLDFPDGIRWFELSIAEKGNGTDPKIAEDRFIVLVREITDRKRTEDKLKISLTEKDTLLKEVNHRVKNNLNVVASILNLQARYVDNEVAREALLESRNRIMTMANIHKSLYGTDNLVSIDFGDYVRQLIVNLVKSSIRDLNDADINFEIEDLILNIDSAIPCSLIINELISNSLKYAFPKGESPQIYIELGRNEDELITLIVADMGIGFPDNIDFRNTESLGMQLVEALVKQLEGTIELDRSEGTKFTIRFTADNTP